jgi:hypothetical protein
MATFRVELLHDGDTTPDEFECYSPEDIAAWQADEWRFVGVLVKYETGRFATITVTSVGLWGVDYHGSESYEYVLDVAADQWHEVRAEFPWLPEHTFTADEIKDLT